MALYPESVKQWHLEQIKNIIRMHFNNYSINKIDTKDIRKHINIIRGLLPNTDCDLSEEYEIFTWMIKYFRYFMDEKN